MPNFNYDDTRADHREALAIAICAAIKEEDLIDHGGEFTLAPEIELAIWKLIWNADMDRIEGTWLVRQNDGQVN